MATSPNKRSHRDYTIGWVCALSKEQTAATGMLDELHDNLPNPPKDPNAYTLGSIGEHNIVIACLPEGKYGTNAAATAATWMASTFPSVRFCLMVGIGGGNPSNNIRLGDVVISKPGDGFPGVIQWDIGKVEQGSRIKHTGSLNNPPTSLLTSLSKLGTKRAMMGSQIPTLLATMEAKWPELDKRFTQLGSLRDILFADDCPHIDVSSIRKKLDKPSPQETQAFDTETEEEEEEEEAEDCKFCDKTKARKRKPRKETRVHYGLIASGNMVIKDAQFRNELDKTFDNKVLCVEMEAAGLMNDFPCLVIRGICDYADAHKSKNWQNYAAAVSAAFAKELLLVVPVHAVDEMDTIASILSDIRCNVGLVVEYLEEVKSSRHGEEDKKVLDWISPLDYGAEHSDVLERRQEGTGHWLLESTAFREFIERNDRRILFCPGIPGAGKTVMAATVIDYLHQQFKNESSIGIAYIYFNFNRYSEQDPIAVFSSLLKQISRRQRSLHTSVTSLYETHVKEGTRPSLKEIIRAFQDVVRIHSRVFVIIDALDECASSNHCREIILSEIIGCTEQSDLSDLKLFATARDIPEIAERFKYALRLEIKAVESDIRTYIDSRLSCLPPTSVINKSKTLEEEIKTGISVAAGGMFLLAQLHFDQLTDCITRKAVIKTLKALPTGSSAYDDTYNAAMYRINQQSSSRRQLAMNVLCWITNAMRPLSVTELQHALGVEIGEDEFDEDNIPQVEDIVSTSVGLITIDKNSEVIRLVHYTTQEFFKRNQGKWLPNAKTYIAEVCSCYLSYCDFTDKSREHNIFTKLKLFSYAVEHWQSHVSMSGFSQRHVNLLKNVSNLRIFEHNYWGRHPNYRVFTGIHIAAESGWNEIVEALLKDITDVDAHDKFNRTPFYLAASSGHDAVMRTLLLNSNQIDINVISSESRYTPLICAAQEGHAAAVKLLLDTGKANAGFTCKRQKAALWYAAVGGHVETVRLLLNIRNYNSYMVREIFSSALLGAVIMKQEPIVHLLLETGHADVNVQTINKCSQFFWDYFPEDAYHDATGNDVLYFTSDNLRDIIGTHLPPRLFKRIGGFTGIVWCYKLAEIRRKPGAFDDITWNYLRIKIRKHDADHIFSSSPPIDMRLVVDSFFGSGRKYSLLFSPMKMFDHSTDATWRYPCSEMIKNEGHKLRPMEYSLNQGKSPLCLAVEFGYENLAKIFLGWKEINVDLTSNDLHLSTALSMAARCGRTDIFRLLLDSGRFDINSKDDFGQTPLMIATLQWHKEIVDLLLQSNSLAIDLQDELGRTALFYAVAHNRYDIAELLINTGKANIHIKDADGRSPLLDAVMRRSEETVRLLFGALGVNINPQDDHGKSLLLFAVESGRENIVRLCLETGKLDVNARDHSGLTPLLLAAKRPSSMFDIIQLLLNTVNVDTNARDYKHQRTALLWAAYAGNLESFKALLQTEKFDIKERDVHGLNTYTLAVQMHSTAIVEYLLSIDAVDLHAEDNKHNETASMWAVNNLPDHLTTLSETEKFNVNEKHAKWPILLSLSSTTQERWDVPKSSPKKYGAELYVRKYKHGKTALMLDTCDDHLNGFSLRLESPKTNVHSTDFDRLDWVAIGFLNGHPEIIVFFESEDGFDYDGQ